MTLGEIIKQFRKENKLSQRQFATKCGISNGYVSFLENGVNPATGEKTTPSITVLKRIASGMSISLDELFTIADDFDISIDSNDENPILSEKERILILAYRAHPEMQDAVNRLLGIEKQPEKKLSPTVSDIKPAKKTYIVRTAGRGEGVKDVEMTEEEIEFYKNLPDVDETDL